MKGSIPKPGKATAECISKSHGSGKELRKSRRKEWGKEWEKESTATRKNLHNQGGRERCFLAR